MPDVAGHERQRPFVVVVDDEPQIVSIILETLHDEDIPAESCGYGHAAFTCLRTKLPEVVLLDIQMPGLDGIQIFSRLKADPATAGMYIIFVTANAHFLDQSLPNYNELGVGVLRKPFDLNDLVHLVKNALGSAGPAMTP
jgi:CheY-like chemotaxis protein